MITSSDTPIPDYGKDAASVAVSPGSGALPRGPASTVAGQRTRRTMRRLAMAVVFGLAGLGLAIGVAGSALADSGW